MSSRKTIFRFFLTYLCVLLPMLLLNFGAQHVVLRQAQKRTDEGVVWQLEQVACELQSLAERCGDYTVRLGASDVMRTARVTGDQSGARKAVELLGDIVDYELTLSDAFVFYDTGYVYSSAGKTNTVTFFDSLLSLDADSAARAQEILVSPFRQLTCLWTRSGAGYLYFHCPISRIQMTSRTQSLNFLAPLSALTQADTQLSGSALDGLLLAFGDGGAVSFVRRGDGVSAIRANNTAGTEPSIQSDVFDGVTISARYDRAVMYQDVRRAQASGTVMLCVGMLASALVSIYLSRRRWSRLRAVEDYVQGVSAPEIPKAEEFGVIVSRFRQMRAEQQGLEQSFVSHRGRLRQQIALILFQGSAEISDRGAMDSLLRECGLTLNEEYFYVGALCPAQEAESALADRLYCETRLSGRRVLLFLGELPNADEDQSLRRADAEHLIAQCGAKSIVAASQVYQPLTMVSYACTEALKELDNRLIVGDEPFVCCVPPKNAAPAARPWFNFDLLTAFSDSLTRGDFAEAAGQLDALLALIDSEPVPPSAERSYLRGCIVQAALTVFKDAGREDAVKALSTLNPEDGAAFAGGFGDILRACREPDEERSDIFTRVLQYVERHYAENDLSYEQVADYAGVTKTYLSRLFRANTNMSYIEYLSRIRLTKADELLRTTDMPLRDITHAVGYLDESSFRRKYRAHFGHSVSDVRRGRDDAIDSGEDAVD